MRNTCIVDGVKYELIPGEPHPINQAMARKQKEQREREILEFFGPSDIEALKEFRMRSRELENQKRMRELGTMA